NDAGEVTTHVDPLFWRTTYTYQGPGDLTGAAYPDGTTEGHTYHQKFHYVTSFTDRNGHTTSYEYDDLGERTAVVDAEWNRTEYTYYGNETKGAPLIGLVKDVKNPRGYFTTYTYDPARRWLR